MRKILFLFMAVMLIASLAMAQSYSKWGNIGGAGYKYSMKAHPVTCELISEGGKTAGTDTTLAAVRRLKFEFVAPFTCLVDSFWIVYSGTVAADTMADADSNAALIVKLYTGGGAGTAPASLAYADSMSKKTLASKLGPHTCRFANPSYGSDSLGNRYLTAGEVYMVQIDTLTQGPTILPKRLRCGWTLLAPDR